MGNFAHIKDVKFNIISTNSFTKEFNGILRIPNAGSIFSSLAKDTSGRNQAQVTWTHNVSTSVGFRAPPVCQIIFQSNITDINNNENIYIKKITEAAP